MTIEEDRIVCGGNPGDFLSARYLYVSGDQFSIGRDLARVWRDRHDGTLRAADALITRAQRQWMKSGWPQNFERVRGAAAELGVDVQSDLIPLTLTYNIPDALLPAKVEAPHCSCAFYPPQSTESGSGVLARNFDFSIESLYDLLGIPVRKMHRDISHSRTSWNPIPPRVTPRSSSATWTSWEPAWTGSIPPG